VQVYDVRKYTRAIQKPPYTKNKVQADDFDFRTAHRDACFFPLYFTALFGRLVWIESSLSSSSS
jgi:hypothetical protein